jgi:hypothetical protein
MKLSFNTSEFIHDSPDYIIIDIIGFYFFSQ